MKVFKDGKGREWQVAVTVGSLLRVKSLLSLDLTELTKGDPPIGVRLTTELCLVGEVLAAIIHPQLKAANVDADDFVESLGGEALAGGFAALAQELVDFFQKTGRVEQASALTAMMKVLTTAADLSRRRIEQVDVAKLVEAELKKHAPAIYCELATSSPASPESTPST